MPVAVPNSMCKQTNQELFDLEIAANLAGHKLAVEVIADSSGKFYGNAMTYNTVDEALSAAEDLAGRWMSIREYRIIAKT